MTRHDVYEAVSHVAGEEEGSEGGRQVLVAHGLTGRTHIVVIIRARRTYRDGALNACWSFMR